MSRDNLVIYILLPINNLLIGMAQRARAMDNFISKRPCLTPSMQLLVDALILNKACHRYSRAWALFDAWHCGRWCQASGMRQGCLPVPV